MSELLDAALEAVDVGPYSLAGDAGCSGPDTRESAGATFLMRVRDDLVEQIRYLYEDDEPVEHTIDRLENAGALNEIADSSVPIYTYDLWQTFVDLAAYHEDPTELGCDGSDMDQAARTCIYMIADRLLYALCDHIKEEWTLNELSQEGDDQEAESDG